MLLEEGLDNVCCATRPDGGSHAARGANLGLRGNVPGAEGVFGVR